MTVLAETRGASIHPAVQNLMLAARAPGIGSCLTTIHRFRDTQVKALVGLPAGVETASPYFPCLRWARFGRPPRNPAGEVTFVDRWG